jgi:hypothetical protein
VTAFKSRRILSRLDIDAIAKVLLGAEFGVGPLALNHCRLALTIYGQLATGRSVRTAVPKPDLTCPRARKALGESA